MKNISCNTFSANFNIETKHGSRLEFVLSDADDRKGESRYCGHVYTTYTDTLNDMLDKEFEGDDSIGITDITKYGDLFFDIRVDTLDQLMPALARCDAVVKKWINKYNINRMKESE